MARALDSTNPESREHAWLKSYVSTFERLLDGTGVGLDGPNPWDIRVHNPQFFRRVLAHGSVGFGETYMEGWWDTDDLVGLIYRLLKAKLDVKYRTWDLLFGSLRARLFNLQRARRAFEVGRHHYDLSHDLYRHMLGRRLIYSCAYWRDTDNLDEAQVAKLELVFRKLGLRSGMRVLDIGCGWGEALKLAAERYGVEGVGITISAEQARYAEELCKGLPVTIEMKDYRDLRGRFDRVFSIGMFEHVGDKNYRRYMQIARACLKDDGVFLLHTIGGNLTTHTTDPWIQKYIFPNGMLPSVAQIGTAIEDLFVMEDWQNLSMHYDRTLMAWLHNFMGHRDVLRGQLDETFFRMWRFYLCASAAGFRVRENQLWQVVLSPNGIPGGYERIDGQH